MPHRFKSDARTNRPPKALRAKSLRRSLLASFATSEFSARFWIMKLARALAALMLLTMDVPFSAAAQTPSGKEAGIEGFITISPTQPGPVRVDAPASQPLANTAFVVEKENAEVASFTTDEHGHFRIQLPPGHYKVSIKGRKTTIGHFGPFEADVVADKMTSVQWKCDSGIR